MMWTFNHISELDKTQVYQLQLRSKYIHFAHSRSVGILYNYLNNYNYKCIYLHFFEINYTMQVFKNKSDVILSRVMNAI